MKNLKIGLQLFSVRDEMGKDFEGTIRAVAEMGYECVEFAGYFGRSAEEVRAICDSHGLEIVSVHQKYDVFMETPEESVAYLKALGVPYCAVPWISRDAWKANFDAIIEDLRKVSALLKKNGIQLLYHNHDFELLEKHGDAFILDAMCSDLSAQELIPELDVCWVHYAGQDPLAYMKKYAHMPVLHLKDFDCTRLAGGPTYALIDSTGKATGENTRQDNGFRFHSVGSGRQDVPAIMKTAEETSVKYVIVEQDGDYDGSSLAAVRRSREYLKSIGY